MGPPMWPWHCGLTARPVSGVEWSGVDKAKVRNVKVIPNEQRVPKDKLLVIDVWFKMGDA